MTFRRHFGRMRFPHLRRTGHLEGDRFQGRHSRVRYSVAVFGTRFQESSQTGPNNLLDVHEIAAGQYDRIRSLVVKAG